eukprot:scaffold502652_cov45-Prasinocladus_malaysianus.AAC.1
MRHATPVQLDEDMDCKAMLFRRCVSFDDRRGKNTNTSKSSTILGDRPRSAANLASVLLERR